MKLKELLKNKLTSKELSLIPSSFDTIGSIALFQDFPKGLKNKQKLIGNTLLKENNNIKTVTIKTKKHSGKYRLRKVKVITGKNTKETTHKENNIQAKLNIETCYFSPRLSNERLRISNLVENNEEVLVMFSGIGIYPLVIEKNSKPKQIYSIEINPEAHKYSLENIKNSKIITPILGDVNKVLPNIYQNIIGLKSAFYNIQLKQRLKKKPNLIEIQLLDGDLEFKLKDLEKQLKKLNKQNIEIFIHQPFRKYKGQLLSLNQKTIPIEAYKLMYKLCKKYNARCVIHPTNYLDKKVNKTYLIDNLKLLEPYQKYFYYENTHIEKFFSRIENNLDVIAKLKIQNFCIDLAHFFCIYNNSKKLISNIKKIQEKCNTYFHISDSINGEEALELGKGEIDFENILQYVNKGCIEVSSKDENNPKEMLNSYDKLKNYTKKFDRIIMPLPKSSEDFLNLAKNHIRKNGVIHFYDFSNDENFPDSSIKKIEKHFENFEVLNSVKCGQYSAGKSRVCIDFKVK
ncbi:hypothetical protein CL617_00085 [archaeon]|nr:hypothetical protein [archaeon]|tara:strand:- start:2547 stop:4091 length:1545 start_codon:yes stop_codon:yes gene_type:complete